jgi:hypothetical protein
MSWGSDAASGASTASTVADTAGSAGNYSSVYGQMADVGGDGTAASPSGFSIGPATTGVSEGPTLANAAGSTGPQTPTLMQNMMNNYENFNKGMNSNLVDAWRDKGMNAGTAGYVYGKVNQFAGAAKGPQPMQPANIIVNNQQPQNEYLKKRGY